MGPCTAHILAAERPSFDVQVLSTAARVGVPMSGENALQRYDQFAFDKICDSAFGQSVMAGRLEVRAWSLSRCCVSSIHRRIC